MDVCWNRAILSGTVALSFKMTQVQESIYHMLSDPSTYQSSTTTAANGGDLDMLRFLAFKVFGSHGSMMSFLILNLLDQFSDAKEVVHFLERQACGQVSNCGYLPRFHQSPPLVSGIKNQAKTNARKHAVEKKMNAP